MFSKAAPVVEPAPDVMHDASPVPLSVLSLDLPAPAEGWQVYLNGRGVEIVVDDLGRPSIAREDAKQLFDEHRESEARKAEMRAAAEKRAVEADQRWRASLPSGVPAGALPPGMSYAEAVHQASLDSLTYQPRRTSVVEDLLSNDGITFHPIQHGPDEE
jgi:hypothetical protein